MRREDQRVFYSFRCPSACSNVVSNRGGSVLSHHQHKLPLATGESKIRSVRSRRRSTLVLRKRWTKMVRKMFQLHISQTHRSSSTSSMHGLWYGGKNTHSDRYSQSTQCTSQFCKDHVNWNMLKMQLLIATNIYDR